MELVNVPVPLPSIVMPSLSSSVGGDPTLVFQTNPLAVTASPPSPVTSPELLAVSLVISVTSPVTTVGNPAVIKLFSSP